MTQLFTNNAGAKLAAAVASGDVTFDVQTGQGAEFPSLSGSDFFIATLESIDGTTREIVKVTARSTDTMTVTRAQEGTSAGTFAAGDKFDCRLTAGGMATIEAMVYDPELLALAGLSSGADKIPYFTGAGTAGLLDRDTDGTLAGNSDTKIATQKAVKTALDLKAPLASPSLTGNPIAPTQSPSDNSTKLATTAYVDAAITAGSAVVADNSISNAKLRDSGALSVIGRSANSSGDPADISTSADGDVLRRSGTTLGFGTIVAAAIGSGQIALARGGTNADLSATGAGFLKQATTGANVTVAAIVENDVGASTNDAGNTSTAITIDWSLGRAQKCTATGSFTLTHSNMVSGLVYTLEVLTGAGSFTATFSSTDWGSASAPTLTVTASKRDTFTFYKSIGGTISGGVFSQAAAP